MKIRDSVAFVTGANRGLGLVFAQELLAADAKKVYSVAQNPESIMESACAVAVAPPRCPCNSRDQKDSDLSWMPPSSIFVLDVCNNLKGANILRILALRQKLLSKCILSRRTQKNLLGRVGSHTED
jgi:NAD(P)-dependent dehydrogenase (short-subunit alcohol dehydrogenase family)